MAGGISDGWRAVSVMAGGVSDGWGISDGFWYQ
jgi:hypothetical protein